jgi:hydrogenase maturation protease
MTQALVVCVGNALVADDGVGENIYEDLRKRSFPDTFRLEHIGVSGIALFDLFDSDDLFILVDAANRGDAPGTIRVHHPTTTGLATTALSAHDIGVGEALALCQLLAPKRIPRRSAIVTIEGECFTELRQQLSPAVQAAIPFAISKVLELVAQTGAIA